MSDTRGVQDVPIKWNALNLCDASNKSAVQAVSVQGISNSTLFAYGPITPLRPKMIKSAWKKPEDIRLRGMLYSHFPELRTLALLCSQSGNIS